MASRSGHDHQDTPMILLPDTIVWYCENGEWVTTYDKSLVSCGACCGLTTFRSLPEWAKQELVRKIKEDTR